MNNQLAIWRPDELNELEQPAPWDFRSVAAIRATGKGFMFVIVGNDDPPALARWSLTYEGDLSKDGDYPSADGMVLDPSNCDRYFDVPSSGTTIDHYKSAGCSCALEPNGAALCIARDAKDSAIVLRFVPGAEGAEVVFRAEDDPFLLGIKGLVTGP
jgi:hypothetical protein